MTTPPIPPPSRPCIHRILTLPFTPTAQSPSPRCTSIHVCIRARQSRAHNIEQVLNNDLGQHMNSGGVLWREGPCGSTLPPSVPACAQHAHPTSQPMVHQTLQRGSRRPRHTSHDGTVRIQSPNWLRRTFFLYCFSSAGASARCASTLTSVRIVYVRCVPVVLATDLQTT